MLKQLGVPFEAEVVSAHRTSDRLFEYAEQARDRGIQVIIAAGGAAHLPGMCSPDLPVLGVPVKSSILNGVDSLLLSCTGVPVKSSILNGVDSLLSIVQMPAGIAVGTWQLVRPVPPMAIMAAQILGLTRPEIAKMSQISVRHKPRKSRNNIPGQM